MNEKKINYLNIFDIDYQSEISTGRLFVEKYKKLHHILEYTVKVNFDNILDFFKDKFSITDDNILHSQISKKHPKYKQKIYPNDLIIIELENELLVDIQEDKIKFYFSDLSKRDELVKIASQITPKKKKKKAEKFYMIVRSQHSVSGFDLQKFKVKKMKINIEDNYNDDFPAINEKVLEFLKDDGKNGIVMFHGKYGTGKSTYIRHLIQHLNKRFIYLPLNLISGLSSPDLVNFFASYKNSVLILEDCEEIIKPRTSGNQSTQALVNLLNLGDGLLSDAMSVKLICTFNAELKKIDPAILRKGRLAIRYEFLPLEQEKAQKLAEKIESKVEIKEPTTLADIFNTNQVSERFDKTKKIGF